MRIVLKIGGSILSEKAGNLNTELLSKYASTVKEITKKGNNVFIVTGGGKLARNYIAFLGKSSESFKDMVGTAVARLNAMVLISYLGEAAYPFPVENFEDVLKLMPLNKILVLGGTQPGQSTNAVAALLAETTNADILINLTNVDGVYTSNPKTNSNATLLTEIKIEKLTEILKSESVKAGKYPLFDPLAIKIISRSKIKTWIINGYKPESILKIIKGEKPTGTEILF